jgi:hypothetical protein
VSEAPVKVQVGLTARISRVQYRPDFKSASTATDGSTGMSASNAGGTQLEQRENPAQLERNEQRRSYRERLRVSSWHCRDPQSFKARYSDLP